MNRRGFLGSILTACAAPAIVRADSLMRIVPRDLVLVTPGPVEDWLPRNPGDIVIVRVYEPGMACRSDPLAQRPLVRDERMSLSEFRRRYPGHEPKAIGLGYWSSVENWKAG